MKLSFFSLLTTSLLPLVASVSMALADLSSWRIARGDRRLVVGDQLSRVRREHLGVLQHGFCLGEERLEHPVAMGLAAATSH